MSRTIDRRSLFRAVLVGAAATAAGAVLGAGVAEALPFGGHALDGHGVVTPEAPISKAHVVVVAPRRRRRWVCRWHRGRRVCGWRWY
ncbi:hypothetical protein K9U39_17290 [Rhodoblastus acidophilus]|uniref:Protamine-2 (Modular protein) n=1 Tax=Candidatus Rhodoblastus alkanivorans TaxID=2954117 RepID=A0ABS9Z1Z4_9HYPH|nr:hypothetical protein [Candidatus Rhodoblastus alkanivorans]MCI4678032.1 hypothetical protein [Candidatus Rhodoblastus alkanivorans]MCI4681627.1 hypothetical protein [Candidatus Rhodoblastus alkanivorans]MDI4642675.1 hypothetical protein [Rhodoblastus acidophilus]